VLKSSLRPLYVDSTLQIIVPLSKKNILEVHRAVAEALSMDVELYLVRADDDFDGRFFETTVVHQLQERN